jgi:hypothetical protein
VAIYNGFVFGTAVDRLRWSLTMTQQLQFAVLPEFKCECGRELELEQ